MEKKQVGMTPQYSPYFSATFPTMFAFGKKSHAHMQLLIVSLIVFQCNSQRNVAEQQQLLALWANRLLHVLYIDN